MPTDPTSEADSIVVEVVYATPQTQRLLSLEVAAGTSALEAVKRSGIAAEFPDIDVDSTPMGIFANRLNGKGLPLPSDYVLQPGDRVEIYRPLEIDPKQARLARAEKKSKGKREQRKD